MMRQLVVGVLVAVGAGGAGLVGPAAAQEVDELDLPVHVADEIIDFFNAAGTVRMQAPATIASGDVIDSDVAVLGGPVSVSGRIMGDVVVVNGDLIIEPGGRIDGDVTVLGGTAEAPPRTVGGRLTIYDQPLTYARRGDRIAYERPRRTSRQWDYRGPSWRSRFRVRVEDAYNRVEGLPVRFGPVFETRGRNPMTVRAEGVWRTDRGFSSDGGDFGWFLGIEQHLGPGGRFSLGGTAQSLVTPIETWGLSDQEASLAAVLFHRDYRDYYDVEGWSVFGRYDDRDEGVRLTVGYRDQDHRFAPVGSPWTLRNNDRAWRPQPLIAEGSLESVFADLTIDRRNDRYDPTDGWYLALRGEGGLSGRLNRRQLDPLDGGPGGSIDPTDQNGEFRSAFVDVRRYARLGPSSDLSLRGVLAGSLDDEPLPAQRQHAMGGEGSLPGYRPFALDCGARDRPFSTVRGNGRSTVFGNYGCDRIALFQAEYRGSFSIDIDLDDDWDEDGWADDWDWRPSFDATPRWAVFFDAGKGWVAENAPLGPVMRRDTDTFADVGVGFFISDVGLYWAYPLTGDDRGVNFFLRLDHRF